MFDNCNFVHILASTLCKYDINLRQRYLFAEENADVFKNYLNIIYICGRWCDGTNVEVKGCLCGVGFLLPFCESWGLNSGGWTCGVRVFTWGAILWTWKQISLEGDFHCSSFACPHAGDETQCLTCGGQVFCY